MMFALMASLLGAAPVTPAAPTAASDDPPIKVWLNQDSYFQRGDKARVNVKLADDGYLVVLRADAEGRVRVLFPLDPSNEDRKSTRLNSSHVAISYAVFCLKKKKKEKQIILHEKTEANTC